MHTAIQEREGNGRRGERGERERGERMREQVIYNHIGVAMVCFMGLNNTSSPHKPHLALNMMEYTASGLEGN